MSDTYYDLTHKGTTTIRARAGQSGTFYWSGFPQLDAGYTLNIAGSTYTVGSGLTLTTTPENTITWAFDFSAVSPGTYQGTLQSDNQALGIDFRRAIKLIIE